MIDDLILFDNRAYVSSYGIEIQQEIAIGPLYVSLWLNMVPVLPYWISVTVEWTQLKTGITSLILYRNFFKRQGV